MPIEAFNARLLYSVGDHPAGSQVRLVPGGWNFDGLEYELEGTSYRLREHEFERVRSPRPVLDISRTSTRSA